MGREIRMVPPNWQHPKDDRGNYQPLYETNFAEKFAEWLADFDRIRAGNFNDWERKCYADKSNPLAAWLLDEGSPHDPNFHVPYTKEEATWVQVYETVSEGTPVSPPFATKEELIDYLVANGDFWDQKDRADARRARQKPAYTRAHAEAFVNAGWAPTMIVRTGGGQPTQITMGIAAASNEVP